MLSRLVHGCCVEVPVVAMAVVFFFEDGRDFSVNLVVGVVRDGAFRLNTLRKDILLQALLRQTRGN